MVIVTECQSAYLTVPQDPHMQLPESRLCNLTDMHADGGALLPESATHVNTSQWVVGAVHSLGSMLSHL